MRHERFYTLVGLFVIVALCLLLVGIAFFYEEYKRTQVQTFVMFFRGSLKGLKAGSPVTYRGVKIGEVKVIEITENQSRTQVRIPVYVQFFVEKSLGFTQDPVHILIHSGYVANISKPNFITGIAEIELLRSNTQLAFTPSYYHGYPIFPTQLVVEQFVSIEDTIKAAKKTFEDISKLVQSKDIKEALNAAKAAKKTFEDISELVRSKEIKEALNAAKAAKKTFEDISTLVRSKEIQEAITATKAMADNLKQFGSNLNQNLPPVVAYLNQSLKQIANAANSVQNLADYLLRYPESLLRGKR